jgi:hypothetical protein
MPKVKSSHRLEPLIVTRDPWAVSTTQGTLATATE